MRILALLGCLQLVTFAGFIYIAHANASEMLWSLGAQMMRYFPAQRQDTPRTLFLNGQALKLSVGSTTHSVSQVLDAFEAKCVSRDGRIAETLENKGKLNGKPITKKAARWLDATLREGGQEQGFVACLDMGPHTLGPQELVERLTDFTRTGDVSKVGELRYVFVQKGEKKTVFTTLWTEGEFNVAAMFPSLGDAPGYDDPEVPRPTGSRRILSTWEAGHAQALRMYVHPKQKGLALSQSVSQQFKQLNWKIRPLNPKKNARSSNNQAFVAEKEEKMIVISTGTTRDGQGFVSMADLFQKEKL